MSPNKAIAIGVKFITYGLALPLIAYAAFFYLRRLRRLARIRRLGAVQVRSVGNTPFHAPILVYRVAKAQAEDKLMDFYNGHYSKATPESPNVVELAVDIISDSRAILTRDPEHIKTVLTTKFADYGKGPGFYRLWKPFLGDSIFTTDGQLWHNSRSLIRPMFIKDRVSDLGIFERKTVRFFSQLPPSGEEVQIMDLLYRWTLDVATEFLLGASVNSLENPKNNFAYAFTEVQRIQMRLMMTIPLDFLISRTDYLRHIRTIEEFIVPFIDRALALPSDELEKLTKSDKGFTFLHHLANYSRDPKVIRDQLIAVLLAGRDTTAATLAWTFYELAAYPEKWKRLRDEVLSTVGPNKAPTYDDLKNMRYLRYALLETLRLYPAVPYNVRAAVRDTTLPGAPGQPDIAVLEGDAVAFQPILMQRRKDLYPPVSDTFADPAMYSPERWFEWQPKSWEFIPFNGGPRICVGQNFALTEMAYFLTRIIQRYERLEYRGDWHAQVHKADIVGRPKFGVPVAFFEAQEVG